MPLDPHALALRRSLAYHEAVAERLSVHPSVLAAARLRVEGWLQHGGVHPEYARAWARILSGAPQEVARAIVDPSSCAADLRQCTPFAGAIDPRTRWRIWAEVRRRSEAE